MGSELLKIERSSSYSCGAASDMKSFQNAITISLLSSGSNGRLSGYLQSGDRVLLEGEYYSAQNRIQQSAKVVRFCSTVSQVQGSKRAVGKAQSLRISPAARMFLR